jgi:murein L,D-transpeptidase YafK
MSLFLMMFLANSIMVKDTNFLERQIAFSRVDAAMEKNYERIEKQCKESGTDKFDEVYLRAFKEEKLLEIWKWNGTNYVLYDTFPICYSSGILGPKKKQGDKQVPEGFYEVKVFNPASSYHLSLGLNYPNKRDEIVNKAPRGGDIYIHGMCVSIGCLAMEDAPIEEIYIVAMLAKAAGQKTIPVHIFPFKMTDQKIKEHIETSYIFLKDFWKSIQPAYTYFEMNKRIPKVEVDSKGNYIVY